MEPILKADLIPVLDLWNWKTWKAPVGKVIRNVIPFNTRRLLKTVPADKMYDDTMHYLQDALVADPQLSLDVVLERLKNGYLKSFGSLRSFHACKPRQLDSYFRDGLRPLSRDWLEAEAFELFAGGIPLDEIVEIVKSSDLDLREGKIYFITDSDDLVATAGHYLIYGPESMNCLWKSPSRFLDSQERQRGRGISTIFECAIPLTLLDEPFGDELVRTLTTLFFKRNSIVPDEDLGPEDWGFSISCALPAICILGHVHPEIIPDPLRHYIKYYNLQRTCPWCVS